jgi:SAM-dependent methyltransferase
LRTLGLASEMSVADAERLPFGDCSFDLVYSWGVLHHSPDTQRCVREVYRVLKPDGIARIMIYHKHSIVGFMLWLRYAALRGRVFMSLSEIYSKYLESPGTKAYSIDEAMSLFNGFRDVRISTSLSHADLLTSDVGQRHRGVALRAAKKLWPRWFIRTFLPRNGLFMCIEARRPASDR